LAPPLEYAFGQTMSLGNENVLMYLLSEKPIATFILCVTPLITWKLWQRSKKLRQVAAETTEEIIKINK